MIKYSVALALGLAAFTQPSSAFAATQITPVNISTGQGSTGTTDPNWNVGTVSAFIPVAVPSVWVGGSSNAGTLGAKWITPTSNGNFNNPIQTFTFSRIFNLPAIADLSSAILSGRMWTDNGVLSMRLNGFTFYTNPNPNVVNGGSNTIPQERAFEGTGFAFSTSSTGNGFLSGAQFFSQNLFEIEVANGGGPAGALVSGDVMAGAVPEPGTWMLMLLGFGAIGFAMRSRAKTQVRFQFA